MEVPFPPKKEIFLYEQNGVLENTFDTQWPILFVMILGRKFCTSAMFLMEPEKAVEQFKAA